jgi:hypothetical protein
VSIKANTNIVESAGKLMPNRVTGRFSLPVPPIPHPSQANTIAPPSLTPAPTDFCHPLYSHLRIILPRHHEISTIALRPNQQMMHRQNILFPSFSDRSLSIALFPNVSDRPSAESYRVAGSFDKSLAVIGVQGEKAKLKD